METSGGRAIITGPIEFNDEDASGPSVQEEDLDEVELKEKEQVKRAALAKFNWFLHFTAYISGSAYLVILGILYSKALPFVFIPVGLWTIGICYHFYYAFFRIGKAVRHSNAL